MWNLKDNRFRMLKDLTEITGKQEMAEKILHYLNEVEEEEIQKRRQVQKEGIKKAKEQGIPLGRPKKKLPKNSGFIFQNYVDGVLSAQQAAVYCGIGVSTLYRRIKEWEKQRNESVLEEELSEEKEGEDDGGLQSEAI